MPRNFYTGGNVGSYRGQTSHAPVAPYAFTSTPGLGNAAYGQHNQPTPHLRQENRTSSAPVVSHLRPDYDPKVASNPQRHSATTTVSTASSSSAEVTPANALPPTNADTHTGHGGRPLSSVNLATPAPTYASVASGAAAKPSPDRYRRVTRRTDTVPAFAGPPSQTRPNSAQPSGSGMATVGHLYSNVAQASAYPALHTYPPNGTQYNMPSNRNSAQSKISSVDDMHVPRQSNTEQAKRYRRRSISSLDAKDYTQMDATQARVTEPRPSPPEASPNRVNPSHVRTGSGGSTTSARSNLSRPSSVKQESASAPLTPLSSNPVTASGVQYGKNDAKLINISPRGGNEPNKRQPSPSPLSRPMAMSPEKASLGGSSGFQPSAAASTAESPAAQQLSALNDKQAKKGSKSRLKRAFSFGSAAELRKASVENNMAQVSHERARLRKERYHDEEEAQQAAIAQKQEAGGIGESIYSGQGHFFTGSTDNLSISSTASSASVMIRKMGKGMKKSTRSLVGLFRPKSVVGVPAADAAVPEPSVAQVSMVTVEAEREKVNVNVNPHDQVGGGTGFPKLERNSLDAATAATPGDSFTSAQDRDSNDSTRPRRSIVGGERERAEVLAAVKKGILKRSGTDSGNSSPVARPIDYKTPDFNLPQIPQVSDSPHSSAPSTPRDDRPAPLGHRRTDSVTIEGEDYFMSIPKIALGESKSAPGTPQSMSRNISFSPRIQFHDTWTSGEYDRRGEIATCNRLTPMLAQQIKEELNSFKMEMEVHEHSKVYTHFF
ncbi:MAG: bud neck involved protein [Caeruleum heppii]|nr:MAG: bud neck involved protein [Caeruleum heppii]